MPNLIRGNMNQDETKPDKKDKTIMMIYAEWFCKAHLCMSVFITDREKTEERLSN